MKFGFVSLILGEGKKLLHSNLIRFSFLLLFLMNFFVLFLYTNTDDFSESYYRKFKIDYEQFGNTEQIQLERAKEECVKRLVMNAYKNELEIAGAESSEFTTSYNIAKEEGFSNEWYEKIKGEYSSEDCVKYGKNFSEEADLLVQILDELKQCINYNQHVKSIREDIQGRKSIPMILNFQSDFTRRNLDKKDDDYKKVQNLSVYFSGTIGLSKILGNSRFDLCPSIMLMILCIYLFMEDRKSGSIRLYRSTLNGRGKLLIVKLCVMLAACALIIVLFWGSIYLYTWQVYGKIPLRQPIQSVVGFGECTICESIGCYLMEYLLQKIFVLFTLGVILTLLSILAGNDTIFIMSCILIYIVSLILTYIPKYMCFSNMRYFNFVYCMKVAPFYKNYLNINVLGRPISHYVVCVWILTICTILFIVINIIQYGKSRKRYHKYSIGVWKGRKDRKKVNISIFRHEMYKLFIGNRVLILLIGLMTVLWYNAFNQSVYLTEEKYYYKNYMNKLEGNLSSKKENYIQKEKRKMEKVEKQIQMAQNDYVNGKLSENEKNQIVAYYELKLKRRSAFQLVENNLNYIKEHKLQHYAFVYEDGWNHLFGITEAGADDDMKNALICVVTIAVCLGGFFANEYETGINRLLKATEKGRMNLWIDKLIISNITMVGIVWIVYGSEFIIIYRKYGFHSIFQKIGNIRRLNWAGGAYKNILIYCIALFAIRIAGYCIIEFIMCGLARVTKNAVSTILLTIIIFAFPIMLHFFGIHFFDKISINYILAGNKILQAFG